MDFERLEVWKRSCRLAVEVYKILHDCKDYSLKDQITRAAVSIPSNIAEGAERKSKKEFCNFVSIAKGSAAELRTQVYIATKIGILSQDNANMLTKELKEISKMLQGLIQSLSQ